MEPPPKPEPTIKEEIIGIAQTPIQEDHNEKYGVPTLEELGFDLDGLLPAVWIGGETEALGNQYFRIHNCRHVFNTKTHF